MVEPSLTTIEQLITRRAVIRTGARLAYAAPLITATFGLTPLHAGAANAISSDKAVEEAERSAKQNSPPVAVAGDGIEVMDTDGDGFETVTVDGSSSADPDGQIVSYRWTLGDQWLASDAVASVKLPVGTHRLLLTVTDDKGATGTVKLRIRVKAGASKPSNDPTPTPQPKLPPAPYELEAKQKFAEVALKWKVHQDTPVPVRIYRTVDDGLNRPIEELEWVLIWEEWEKRSYRDVDVAPGVPYLYVVRSFDGTNESERSNVAAIILDPVEQSVQQPAEEQVVESAPVEEAPPVEDETVLEPPVETDVVDEPTPTAAASS
jgi:hypothetical protein